MSTTTGWRRGFDQRWDLRHEESTRREIREICGELAGDLGFQAEFVLFEDGNEVLSSSVQLDVLILDIEMPGINVI